MHCAMSLQAKKIKPGGRPSVLPPPPTTTTTAAAIPTTAAGTPAVAFRQLWSQIGAIVLRDSSALLINPRVSQSDSDDADYSDDDSDGDMYNMSDCQVKYPDDLVSQAINEEIIRRAKERLNNASNSSNCGSSSTAANIANNSVTTYRAHIARLERAPLASLKRKIEAEGGVIEFLADQHLKHRKKKLGPGAFEIDRQERTRLPVKESIFTFAFLSPREISDSNRNYNKYDDYIYFNVHQTVEVLGRQTLADLKVALYCVSELAKAGEGIDEEGLHKKNYTNNSCSDNNSSSGNACCAESNGVSPQPIFFIENNFYQEDVHCSNENVNRIKQWFAKAVSLDTENCPPESTDNDDNENEQRDRRKNSDGALRSLMNLEQLVDNSAVVDNDNNSTHCSNSNSSNYSNSNSNSKSKSRSKSRSNSNTSGHDPNADPNPSNSIPRTSFDVLGMDTLIEDISWEVGKKYLFLHLGSCEHIVVLLDVRHPTALQQYLKLIPPKANAHSNSSTTTAAHQDTGSINLPSKLDPEILDLYPKERYLADFYRRNCGLCEIFTAKFLVFNDRLSESNPTYFCQQCFRSLHYDENDDLIYDDFAVFPYWHDVK